MVSGVTRGMPGSPARPHGSPDAGSHAASQELTHPVEGNESDVLTRLSQNLVHLVQCTKAEIFALI